MNVIVVVDQNWAIGQDGDQLVYIPGDLKRFQALTTGHPVVLGRKTLATFPGGRPLKNRRNLILSATPGYQVEGGEVYPCLEALLPQLSPDTFVIGGESVYTALLPHCATAYVTKIRGEYPADRFFPNLDSDPQWQMTEEGPVQEENGIMFQYLLYRRK